MKKQTDTEFTHKFGKMIKGKSSLLLEEGQLTDTQNMMPGYEWEQRKGMTALTASAIATGLRFKSLCQFRDLRGDTNVLLAHTYEGVGGEDLYVGDALPPSAIGWTKKYDLTAGCTKCQFANVSKALIVANTKDFLIWRGNEYFPTGVWKYNSAADQYTLFADELFDNDTDTKMPLDGLNTDEAFVVLSDMPLDTIKIIGGDFNTAESFMMFQYWNGAWKYIRQAGWWSDGDNFDEEITSTEFANWDDDDANNGVSEQVTFQDKECMKLDTNAFMGANYAMRSQDIGTVDGLCSISILAYHEALGTKEDADQFYLWMSSDDVQLSVQIDSAGVWVYDGASFNEAGDGVSTEGEWIVWTFEVDFTTPAAATVDVYRNSVLIEAGMDCSETNGFTTGDIKLRQRGDATADRISYVSQVVVGTGLQDDGLEDGTKEGDITLAQSGDITWGIPVDEIKTDIQGIPGYAYRVSASAVLDNPTSLTGLSVHAPIGPVVNIWNSQWEPPTGCYVYDGTDHTDYMAYVNNTVETQFMDLAGVTTTDKIYVGFVVRVNKILLWPAIEGKNSNNVSITSIKYHNASGAATTVGAFVDTTEVGTAMLSQKGAWSWVDPGESNEKMTIIGGDETPMYWYEIIVDAALEDPTQVYYIRGVPITKDPDPSRGVFAYKRRCWQLAPRNHENKVRYAAQELPNTWNGSDSGYIAFGERPLQGAAPFYNETLLFADTELWMLQGNSPSNFGRIRLSAKIGTSSAESIVNIESGVIVADSLKVVVAWQFFDGFWMFDGVRIWKLSSPDIDTFFDPDHEDYIPQAYLDQTVGEYDYASQTVRWAVYSGAGATSPTKVIVMHFPTLNFGIFDYATDIDAMLSVVSDKYYLVGGGHSDGRFYQLDDGLTDLLNTTATAVDAFIITRDEYLGYSDGTRQRLLSIWYEAQAGGGQLEVDEYPDGSKTPQNILKTNMSVTGKIFGAVQRTLKLFAGQKTTKFRIRNRSKNARMKLLGHSTTIDKDRIDE